MNDIRKILRRKNLTLKTRLIASFCLLLLIPTIFIGIFSFQTAKNQLETELMEQAEKDIEQLDHMIEDFLVQKSQQIDVLREKWTIDSIDRNHVEETDKILHSFIELNSDVDSIFIATKKGSYYQVPSMAEMDTYDPTASVWYLGAEEQPEKIYISNPYINKSDGEMVVTIAGSLQDEKGVIGLKIKLSALQALVNEKKIGKEGYAFVIDSNKNYIAHPTEEIGSPGTKNYIQQMSKSNQGTFDYSLDGKDKKLAFKTNERTGWKIAGSMYSKEVTDSASPIMKTLFIVIIVFLLIGAVIIYLNIRSIILPINSLKEKAEKIGNGDLKQ